VSCDPSHLQKKLCIEFWREWAAGHIAQLNKLLTLANCLKSSICHQLSSQICLYNEDQQSSSASIQWFQQYQSNVGLRIDHFPLLFSAVMSHGCCTFEFGKSRSDRILLLQSALHLFIFDSSLVSERPQIRFGKYSALKQIKENQEYLLVLWRFSRWSYRNNVFSHRDIVKVQRIDRSITLRYYATWKKVFTALRQRSRDSHTCEKAFQQLSAIQFWEFNRTMRIKLDVAYRPNTSYVLHPTRIPVDSKNSSRPDLHQMESSW
jgi:hypothetical protein